MKKNIFYFILGLFVATTVCVGAGILYKASDIEFESSNDDWKVDNVQDAIDDIKDNYVSKTEIEKVINNNVLMSYEYTGTFQEFVVPIDGIYKIELWGASGASGSKRLGGKGAYVSGILSLKKGDKLYVYVGGKGEYATTDLTGGGYNGGGNNYFSTYTIGGSGGGGATDIRLVPGEWNNLDSLKSRVMVAAGGGGSGFSTDTSATNGGDAGGLIGFDGGIDTRLSSGSAAKGGTQSSGGSSSGCGSGWCQPAGSGSFGIGGNAASPYNTAGTGKGYLGGSGGGGYYGGGGGGSGYSFSGAGGSSYIKGYEGCDTTYVDKQGTVKIIGSIMKAGNESMPTYDGKSTMVGNTGNGYAKITLISID